MKYIWKTQKGEELDVDTIDNVYHLRNIVKMLMRQNNELYETNKKLVERDEITLNGEIAKDFNDMWQDCDEREDHF